MDRGKNIQIIFKKIIYYNFDYDNEDESNKLFDLIKEGEEENIINEKKENDYELL